MAYDLQFVLITPPCASAISCSKHTASPPRRLEITNPLALSFETLPSDLIIQILAQLTLPSLLAFIRVSRVAHSLYISHPYTVLIPVIRNTFSPAAFNLLEMWRPGSMSKVAREHMLLYTNGMFGGEDPRLSDIRGTIGMAEVRRLVEDSRLVRSLRSEHVKLLAGASGKPGKHVEETADPEFEIEIYYSILSLGRAFHPPPTFDAADQLCRPTGGRTPVPFDFMSLLNFTPDKLRVVEDVGKNLCGFWPWARRLVWPQGMGPSLGLSILEAFESEVLEERAQALIKMGRCEWSLVEGTKMLVQTRQAAYNPYAFH